MKIISAPVQAELDSGTPRLATLWRLTRRDGQVFYFTDHNKNIVQGGNTYLAAVSYNRTATADQAGFAPANMEVESVLDDNVILESDIIAGLWDYSQVEIWATRFGFTVESDSITGATKANPCRITAAGHPFSTGDEVEISGVLGMTQLNNNNYTVTYDDADHFFLNVDSSAFTTYVSSGTATTYAGQFNYRKGRIGQVETRDYSYRAEFLGLAKPLLNPVVRPYLPGCAAALGDAECGVSLGAFTVTGTVATVDSTGLLITDAARTEADNTFAYGIVTMTSGDSSGYSMEVKSSLSSGSFTLQQPLPFGVAAGDTYSMVQGCDKTFATCKNTFNNVVNFRGFPHMPGMDKVLQYATR